jgi:hypothetical protein
MQRWALAFGIAVGILAARTSSACVGTGCIEIWSTESGGGALTVYWDFTTVVQTYQAFCASDGSACLYNTIDPGFMAPDPPAPASGFYRITDGTTVSIQIVMADPGLAIEVNGQKLYQPGDSAQLGVQPPIHNHPSWQIVVPANQYGNFHLVYRLTTDAPAYTNSQVYTQVVTNIPPPEETPPPTPAPASRCAADCDGDVSVTIDELLVCVNTAIGGATPDTCPPCDVDGDGTVTVNEIIAAVGMALDGCPTAGPATLDEIQATIFTPRCATAMCHDAVSKAENLDLAAGASYGQLVGVPSTIDATHVRVDPGHPESSFLVTKITGPPPAQGRLMPLTGAPLSAEQLQLMRKWILQGANP